MDVYFLLPYKGPEALVPAQATLSSLASQASPSHMRVGTGGWRAEGRELWWILTQNNCADICSITLYGNSLQESPAWEWSSSQSETLLEEGSVFGYQVVKTACVFSSPRPVSVAPAALSEKNKIKQRVEVDSLISVVSSLFILHLQRSISLLLS